MSRFEIVEPHKIVDSRYESRAGWMLVDDARALKIEVGDTVMDSDGERYVVESLHPPHKPSAQGKVTVSDPGERDFSNTWYASVVGCSFEYMGESS